MDIQGILQKIDADAREAARKTLADAQANADSIAAQSHAQIEGQRLDMQKRVAADSIETERRMRRMAELEDKKAALAAKRGVMDKAFDEGLRMLLSLPDQEARAFFQYELINAARGGETLYVGRTGANWFDDGFLDEVNAQLSQRGVVKPIILSDERINGRGFHLRAGGALMDCTFEALLADSRMTMESDVAKALFD